MSNNPAYDAYLATWLTYEDQATYEKILRKRLDKYMEAEADE